MSRLRHTLTKQLADLKLYYYYVLYVNIEIQMLLVEVVHVP